MIQKMKLFSNLLFFSNLAESKNRRPNVIILNTDDFGIGDFQIYNREAKVPTPNIDRLGHEGVKFLVDADYVPNVGRHFERNLSSSVHPIERKILLSAT